MFRTDEAFLQKWKAILNQCSTDLMLLIMEYSMETVSETEKEISTLESKLQSETDTATFDNKSKKIKEVTALERHLKEFKIRKYKRDTKDYSNDTIYNLKPKNFKKVTWGTTIYSNYDSTKGDSSAASGDEGPSYREPRERAAKGRAKESFFQARPQRRGRRKT